MKKIRERLTYANVMSSVAVFLALGGGTAAVALSGRNSVHSNDIAPNAARGKDVNEASLGQVPDAKRFDGQDRESLKQGYLGMFDSDGEVGVEMGAGDTSLVNPINLNVQGQCQDVGGDPVARLLIDELHPDNTGYADSTEVGGFAFGEATPADDRVLATADGTAPRHAGFSINDPFASLHGQALLRVAEDAAGPDCFFDVTTVSSSIEDEVPDDD